METIPSDNELSLQPYLRKTSVVDRVLSAASRTGSLSRKAIMNVVDDKPITEGLGKIVVGEKEVSPRDFLNWLGAPKYKTEGTLDKVVDLTQDIAVDLATDPLFALFGIAGKVGAAGARILNASEVLGKRAAQGAIAGSLFADENDSIGDIALKTATGALVGSQALPALNLLKPAAKEVGDSIINTLIERTAPATMSRFKNIMNPSKAFELANNANQRMRFLKDNISRGYLRSVDELNPEEVSLFSELMRELGSQSFLKRKVLIDGVIKKQGEIGQDALNAFTELTNRQMAEKFSLASASPEGALTFAKESGNTTKVNILLDALKNKKITDAVDAWRKQNAKTIEEYNKLAVKGGAPAIIPTDFYYPTVLSKKDANKDFLISMGLDPNQVKGFTMKESGTIDTKGLNVEQQIDLYTDRLADTLLTREERQARQLLALLRKATDETKIGSGIHKFMNVYDGVTNWFKTLVLNAGYTFAQNSLTDGLTKSLILNGVESIPNVLKNLTNTGLFKDILNLNSPQSLNKSLRIKNNDVLLAQKYGAISTNQFDVLRPALRQALQSGDDKSIENITKFLTIKKGPEDAKQIVNEINNAPWIVKTSKSAQDFLNNYIGRFNSSIESLGRIATFRDMFSSLAKDMPNAAKAIEASKKLPPEEFEKQFPEFVPLLEKTGKIVSDAFFDYSNVTLFEEKIMRRLVPFWTYFSRNFEWWINKTIDNPVAVSNAIRPVRLYLGERPTREESSGIPDYLLKQGARVKRDEQGNVTVSTMPIFSMFDMLNTFQTTELPDEIITKIHPAIKALTQVLTNKDLFLGGEFFPSTNPKQKKRVFSESAKYVPTGLVQLMDGKTFVTKDLPALAIEAQKTILPTPLLDRVAQSILDYRTGRKDLEDIKGTLGPVKVRRLSKDEMVRTRKFTKKKPENPMTGLLEQMNL